MIPEPKLSHLYQEVILDHNRRPRNFGEMPDATVRARGVNPLCGDDYQIFLEINPAGEIQAVRFLGSGCAISKASASILTEMIRGKDTGYCDHLKNEFIRFMTQDKVPPAMTEAVGKLKLFEGVKEFPVRVKCATLIWHVLEEALKSLPEKKEGGRS